MGLIRMVLVAGLVGVGVVGLREGWFAGAPQEAQRLAEQARAARELCEQRPQLCAALAGAAAETARQEAQRRLSGQAESTGATVLPAHPPPPPRRPGARTPE